MLASPYCPDSSLIPPLQKQAIRVANRAPSCSIAPLSLEKDAYSRYQSSLGKPKIIRKAALASSAKALTARSSAAENDLFRA